MDAGCYYRRAGKSGFLGSLVLEGIMILEEDGSCRELWSWGKSGRGGKSSLGGSLVLEAL